MNKRMKEQLIELVKDPNIWLATLFVITAFAIGNHDKTLTLSCLIGSAVFVQQSLIRSLEVEIENVSKRLASLEKEKEDEPPAPIEIKSNGRI